MEALLNVLVFWVWAPLLMLAVSASYFFASPIQQSFASRIVLSAHGLLAAILCLSALLVAAVGVARPALGHPYLLLWLLPVAFSILTLRRFRGHPRTHLLLVPLGVAALWSVIVGFTVIAGGK